MRRSATNCEARLNPLRMLSGVALIFVVILSVYFGAVAAAPTPSPIGPSLALYQLGSQGQIVGTAANVFEAGAEVGVAVPAAASPPYTVTLTNLSGLSIWSQQNSSLPTSGLISIGLSPAQFPPGTSYSLMLQFMVPYSPGFASPQESTTSFFVVPAIASLLPSSYSSVNNTVQTHLILQDANNNPLVGVRVGLFLIEGNTSLQITTEKTDMFGTSSFKVGESLGGGTYQFQARVLDSSAVSATPVQLPTVSVNYAPTILAAWTPVPGSVESRLLKSDTQAPVNGRLLILERRLTDGNWTVISQAYSDNMGQALFPTNTTRTLRVRAATAASRVSGSWRGRASSESPTHTESKPSASALSASASNGAVSWTPSTMRSRVGSRYPRRGIVSRYT